MSGGGRRSQRDELQSTWHVYDALRPIRRADLEDSAEPTPPAAAIPPAGGSEASDRARGHSLTTTAVRLPSHDDVTSMSDDAIAALVGITAMDVREARRWAREQTERLGPATIDTTSEERH